MPSPERRKRPTGRSGALVKNLNAAGNKPVAAGAQAAALVADVTFRRRVQRFWPLGDRVLAELLAHLAVHHDCRSEIEHFIDRSTELAGVIRQLRADRWPPLPLRAVR